MLLASEDWGCSQEALTVAAMCSVQSPLLALRPSSAASRPGGQMYKEHAEAMSLFASAEGDHMSLLNIFRLFQENSGGQPGSVDAARAWCDENFLHHRVLARAAELRRNLQRLVQRALGPDAPLCSCGDDSVALRKCIVSGFFGNAAQLEPNGHYRTVRGGAHVQLHSSSVLARYGAPPEWLVFNDLTHNQKVPQMRDASRIDPRWLLELAGHYYSAK